MHEASGPLSLWQRLFKLKNKVFGTFSLDNVRQGVLENIFFFLWLDLCVLRYIWTVFGFVLRVNFVKINLVENVGKGKTVKLLV